MFKVLHTGDLHLGSAFAGLSMRESEARRQQQLDSFRRMMQYAADEEVALVLIAGDLFDTDRVPTALLDDVLDAVVALPCPVVISPGNHDPYRRGSPYASEVLPENLFVFRTEELERFSFPEIGNGVDVFGYAFCGASLSSSPLQFLPDNSCLGDGISFLLCHGDLDLPLSKYGPIASSDLARCGADYVALGHIHNVSDALSFFGDSAVAYCGFAEGRSFDECGFGSFRLLTFDESAHSVHPLVKAERIRTSDTRYESDWIDVTGIGSDAEAAELLDRFLSEKGYGKETVLRLFLEGEVSIRYTPDQSRIQELLSTRNSPSPLILIDRTLPIFDASYLEEDLTIRGELYRILKPKMLDGTPKSRADAAAALRIGLAALDGRPIF